MRRAEQLTKRLAALVVGALLVNLALPGRATAGDKDTDAVVAIAEAMNEFLEGKSADALKKLDASLKTCGKVCTADTRSQLHFHIGVIHGLGEKNKDKARASFEAALRESPKYVPDRQFMSKDLDKLWAEAKVNAKKGGGAAAPAKAGPTKEQSEAFASAMGQLANKDWSSCMGTLIAAMAGSEFAAGKLLLAKCQDAGDLILEAAADAKVAAQLAEQEGNADVGRQAAELIERLENDTPTITLQIPKAVDKPKVTIDGVEIADDKIDKPIPHNPGKAAIEVKGKRGPYPYSFKSTETVDRGEKISVNAEQADTNTSAVQQCISAARSAADLTLCIETGGKGRGLTFRGALEFMTYHDNTQVNVWAPALAVSLENPTSGWSVNGAFLVDVVSTASPDIVATASRRFDQKRFGGSLAGQYKIGPAKIGLNGEVSGESDYLARSVGVSGSADLRDKTVTPTLAYNIGFDVLGRGDTPYDVFSRDLMRHEINAGVSVILDASTVVVGGGTAQIELGDTSKPYRYIPMFTADDAKRVPRGATAELVSSTKLAPAPLEQLPDSRYRFALAGGIRRRFDTATIRADERLYIDTWGLKASTTDARFFYDFKNKLRVGPHLRFHIQSPVAFWQRAYSAAPQAGGWELPKFRTGDRELGPLFGVTAGASVRYPISDMFAAQIQVEGIYTQFLDHIYVVDRLGLFTTTTIEMEIE